jgi:hypothetical protein
LFIQKQNSLSYPAIILSPTINKKAMKQTIKTWIAASALVLTTLSSFSQDEKPATPRWVSDKGYWVVESNIHTPLDHIIRFYTNDDVLIYKESLSGVRLKPDKRKVKMKLKKILESSVVAWQQRKTPEENKNYVMAILK